MIAECAKCGQPLMDDTEYCPQCNQRNPGTKVGTFGFVPWWGWVFVLACGAIPLVTLGGVVPLALGLGAAAVCATTAKKPDRSVGIRVAISAAVTVAAWLALLLFLAIVAALRS